MTLRTGEAFAGYTIVGQLGSGGMGEVYLAEHPRLPRREAIKILRAEISADEGFRARFIREADSIAALDHPHIVTVYDRGETHGRLWIATQYVEGADAAQQLRADRYPGGIPVDEATDIAAAVAAALDHAHGRGLIHRDVKPANILLAKPDSEGIRRVYLADFGIVRPLDDPAGLTATNYVLGTFAYAAPEQLQGTALDGRADQYALAAAIYHLLTGQPVFPDPNPVAVMVQHLTRPAPAPSSIRPELAGLDAAFTRALAKDPGDRFPRCRDFAAAIAAAAARSGIGFSSTAPTQQAPTPRVDRPPQRKPSSNPPPQQPSDVNIGQPTRSGVNARATAHPSGEPSAASGQTDDDPYLSRVFNAQTSQELAAARSRLEKAANSGDLGAMNALGVLLDSQWVPPDLPAARAWYEKAANAGHVEAMYNLGVLLGLRMKPPDLVAARAWYEKAANAGHVEAMAHLGVLLHRRAPRDVSAARGWFEKAADVGHLGAMYNLGVLLEFEAPRDVSAARTWYDKAATGGHLDAMVRLGHVLLRLNASDRPAARAWYEKAATAGHLDAMQHLGRLLTRWDPPDLPAARAWLEQASATGDLEAMMDLGMFLEQDWVPPDRDAARVWYQKIADAVQGILPKVREAARQESLEWAAERGYQGLPVDVMLEDSFVLRVEERTLVLAHPDAVLAELLNETLDEGLDHVLGGALEDALDGVLFECVRCEAV